MPEPRPTADLLGSFAGRGACTDAERRATLAVHDRLRERGHEAWVETLWVRPQWAGSLALHSLLGVAASLAATASPLAGLNTAALALVSYGLELAGRGGLLRMLFVRRATQVLIVEPLDADRVALLICASLDAPRRGLVFRDGVRAAGARLQRLAHGHGPPALVWVLLALAGVAATAGARLAGAEGVAVGVVQFLPTVGLLLTLTAALDVMLSSPASGKDEAAAVALAVALHDELSERPPERLSPALVLAGAGSAFPYAVQAHLRRERPDPARTVVLELAPCAGRGPAASSHLGVLLALPVHPQLRIAAGAAGLSSEVVHSPCAAVAAHRRGIPAMRLRCADLQACVSVVDALDAELDVVD